MVKKIGSFITVLLVANTLFSQDITGQWNGSLTIQGTQLRLVFHLVKSENTYSATMDSPDQGAKGIPVTQTRFENGLLTIEMPSFQISYSGELKDSLIVGLFKQAGMQFPMNLSRKPIEKVTLKRPQTPTEPYPYYTEDVTFENPIAHAVLAGTLTMPKKRGHFPAVILISGSGPQNRDEELFGHKPFLVLADYLTKHGIAVLRFDDRGVGHSTGNFKEATSADFATDVERAIAYLKTRKEIDASKIGLMGHSEGGVIAPMVAVSNPSNVAFIVLLAGTGMRGDSLLLLQAGLIAEKSGIPSEEIRKTVAFNKLVFDVILHAKSLDELEQVLTHKIQLAIESDSSVSVPEGMDHKQFIKAQVQELSSPWFRYFVAYDPIPTLEKLTCPVLAVNGENDIQVPSNENLTAIEKAVKKGGNNNVTCIAFPGLNHLFQECSTCSIEEYGALEQTFSPKALDKITRWIINKTTEK